MPVVLNTRQYLCINLGTVGAMACPIFLATSNVFFGKNVTRYLRVFWVSLRRRERNEKPETTYHTRRYQSVEGCRTLRLCSGRCICSVHRAGASANKESDKEG